MYGTASTGMNTMGMGGACCPQPLVPAYGVGVGVGVAIIAIAVLILIALGVIF